MDVRLKAQKLNPNDCTVKEGKQKTSKYCGIKIEDDILKYFEDEYEFHDWSIFTSEDDESNSSFVPEIIIEEQNLSTSESSQGDMTAITKQKIEKVNTGFKNKEHEKCNLNIGKCADTTKSKKRHKCHLCEYSAIRKSTVKEHIDLVHLNLRRHQCEECDFATSRKHVLTSHIKTIHLNLRQQHKCPSCDYVATQKSHLKRHIDIIHLKMKNYKCQSCDYSTYYHEFLKQHEDTVHLNLKYKCHFDSCNFSSTWKMSLKRHMDTIHFSSENENSRENVDEDDVSEQFVYDNAINNSTIFLFENEIHSSNVAETSCKEGKPTEKKQSSHQDTLGVTKGEKIKHKNQEFNAGPEHTGNKQLDLHIEVIDTDHSYSKQPKWYLSEFPETHKSNIKFRKCPFRSCENADSEKAILKRHQEMVHFRSKEEQKQKTFEYVGIKMEEDILKQFADENEIFFSNVPHTINDELFAHQEDTLQDQCLEECPATGKIKQKNKLINAEENSEKNWSATGVKTTEKTKQKFKAINVDPMHQEHAWCHLNMEKHADMAKSKERHKCHLCEYSAIRKSAIKEHIDFFHLNLRRHQCEECDFATTRKHVLTSHINTIHLNLRQQHKCPSCDYVATQKAHLKRHIDSIHLKMRKHKCQSCDYSTYYHSSLKQHEDTVHLNLKEFKCDFDSCDYATASKYNLKQHKDVIHLNLKPFKCEFCQYVAAKKAYLEKHIEFVHMNLTPYKCDHCNYSGSQKEYLKRHIEAVHLNFKRYKCEFCDFGATYKRAMNNHLNAVHSELQSNFDQNPSADVQKSP